MERYFITISRGALNIANKVMVDVKSIEQAKEVSKELYTSSLDNYNINSCIIDKIIIEDKDFNKVFESTIEKILRG